MTQATLETPAESTPNINLNTHTPGTLAMANRKYRLAGDIVAKAVSKLPDQQRAALRWLDGYGRARNLSLEELGALLRKNDKGDTYSTATVYAALTGRREEQGAGLDAFCASIDQLRRRVEETTASRNSADGFIETSLSQKIFRHMRRNFEKKSMTCIFGESQIGKSRAAEEYKTRYNHGETILVRMPTRGSYGEVLEEFATQLGIPVQNQQKALRRRIIDSFDEKMQIVVDEAHQCLAMKNSVRGLTTLDFIREIHDRRKTPVTLLATYTLKNELLNGIHAKMLRQIWLRCRVPALNLPAAPNQQDRAAFALAYGLDPATNKPLKVEALITGNDGREHTVTHRAIPVELEDRVLTQWGLGRWFAILDEAREIALSAGSRITWGKVIAAHARFEADSEVVS